MKIQYNHFKIFFCTLILSAIISCSNNHVESVRNIDFNSNWKFKLDSASIIPDINNNNWQNIDLPHDWSIQHYDVQDDNHIGPFYNDSVNGRDIGHVRSGIGWYYKQLIVPKAHKDQSVYLNFDGVMSESEIYINSTLAYTNVYGYTAFNVDISPYLNKNGTENIIAVRVNNPQPSSRWFTGAGIYRNVTLSYINPIHIDTWGVQVTTTQLDKNSTNLKFNVNLQNSTEFDAELTVKIKIKADKWIMLADTTLMSGKNALLNYNTICELKNPKVWDIDSPNLYDAEVSIFNKGLLLDVYRTQFGIRTINYNSNSGLLLNGQKVLLKGACMHHDNGLIGAAAFKRAEERKVHILKQNGYNAIRTSHNPPSKFFLDACDQQGMLVINESFDMWEDPMREYDYARYYKRHWKSDTESLINRDYNHPCIIMWSIGNEITERADSNGYKIALEAYDFIKQIDSIRPITIGFNGFWDHPDKTWDDSEQMFNIVDIGGYNYEWKQYERDHKRYPERLMYGSENLSQQAFEGWSYVLKHKYVIGDFVWTAFDYIGEAGIGRSEYSTKQNVRLEGLAPYPWYISGCGEIDILGNKKAPAYYRDVLWGNSKIEMAVHEPIESGKFENISWWGWPKEFQRWSGTEGQIMDINVYTSCDKVKLWLNDNLVDEKDVYSENNYKVSFQLPFEKGILKAEGIIDGNIIDTKELSTVGDYDHLEINAEEETIIASRNEIAYINVSAVDAKNQRLSKADHFIQVEVQGEGDLLAAGNASPFVNRFKNNGFKLYQGRGLIIVRSNGKEGEIKVKVTTPDGKSTSSIIVSKQEINE